MWFYHRVIKPNDANKTCKQCRPWSDCSSMSSLIWVYTVCPGICVQNVNMYGRRINENIRISNWALPWENLPLAIYLLWYQVRLKQACSATETSNNLRISDKATIGIIRSTQWIKKVLTRLPICIFAIAIHIWQLLKKVFMKHYTPNHMLVPNENIFHLSVWSWQNLIRSSTAWTQSVCQIS